jgi:hypothetical protein
MIKFVNEKSLIFAIERNGQVHLRKKLLLSFDVSLKILELKIAQK